MPARHETLRPPAAASKPELRRMMKERLATFDAAAASSAAAAAGERLLALPEIQQARSLLVCLSFGREIDTWRLVAQLQEEGKTLYVPRAVPGTRRLTVHAYPCALETLSFGLRQPVASAPALADDALDTSLDAVVVVGLAFDRSGHRLGYGGGYFDRFLAGRPWSRIGLAYSWQLLDALPSKAHDVLFDAIVTDREVWRRDRPNDEARPP